MTTNTASVLSTFKIETPIPNHVHNNERTLSGYIDTITKYKSNIDSLYFPLGHVEQGVDAWGIRAPQFVYRKGSADATAVLNWETALREIFEYQKIPASILMNDTYNRAFHTDDLTKMLKKLEYYSKFVSIASVTIADFTLIPALQKEGYNICLSTNSHNSFAELDMAMDIYGTDAFSKIVLQRDLNRNPKKLYAYLDRRPGLLEKLILMVNEGCINACPYKASGDVEISIADLHTTRNHIHTAGCTILNSSKLAWTFLTSPFLTCSMLQRFHPKISVVKLAGRNLPASNLKKQLDHWTTGAEYKLQDILNVFFNSSITTKVLDEDEEYVSGVFSCNKECLVCRKCEQTYLGTLHHHPSPEGMFKIIEGLS